MSKRVDWGVSYVACSINLRRQNLILSVPSIVTHQYFGFRKIFQLLCMGLLVLALSACGGLPRSDSPARVEDRGASPPTARGEPPRVAAYTPPAQPNFARPAPKRAVSVLMQRAEDQRRSGDMDAATVSLERALRIAPDDAVLWNRLAEVRMDQRNFALVTQLAAKSNALASRDDQMLRSANWTLIARARQALGDTAGARTAEQRADELR